MMLNHVLGSPEDISLTKGTARYLLIGFIIKIK
jgi:hypothetical protein